MANITPIFELSFMGSGLTSTKDDWYDIGLSQPNPSSPVPSGKQIWLGYSTFISEDKNLIFEVRSNLTGNSTGTLANTQLVGFASVSAADSKDMDFYLYGNIITLFPVSATSTGVEKLWLRVRSGTQTVAAFDYILRYTLY